MLLMGLNESDMSEVRGGDVYVLGKRLRRRIVFSIVKLLIALPVGITWGMLRLDGKPSLTVVIGTVVVFLLLEVIEFRKVEYIKYLSIDEPEDRICMTYFKCLFPLRTYFMHVDDIDVHFEGDAIRIISSKESRKHVIELGEDCDKQTFYALRSRLEEIIGRKRKTVGRKKNG